MYVRYIQLNYFFLSHYNCCITVRAVRNILLNTDDKFVFLATGMWAKQYRDGKFIKLIAKDTNYHYGFPNLHILKEPVEVWPGKDS